MNTLILITGIPATGKSTLAAALSKEMAIPAFSKDRIKEHLFDTLGFKSRAEKVALGRAAEVILYDAAANILKTGGSVILENNFEATSRPGLERLIAETGCTVITLQLTGDLSVIYARFCARQTAPDRHRGHVTNTCYPEKPGEEAVVPPLDFEDFVASVKSRGMLDFAAGHVIQVDVTDYSKLDIKSIIHEISAISEM